MLFNKTIESLSPHVFLQQQGALGIITLNRPDALNATSYDMVIAIGQALNQFEENAEIKHVVITSSSRRSFCAGGDIRAAYFAMKQGAFDDCETYFKSEYQLVNRLVTFSKPIYAFIDGYCFGGGMGLSVHCTARIAGENALFSMPETAIGFFPDVGAAYFYNQLKDEAEGLFLACTGHRFNCDHAIRNGIATHAIDVAQWKRIFDQLAYGATLDECVFEAAMVGDVSFDAKILAAFSKPTLIEVMQALPTETISNIKSLSPFSIAVTYAYMKKMRGLSRQDVLENDAALAMNFVRHGEFLEGVRALLIDKDKAPKWTIPWESGLEIMQIFEKIPMDAVDKMFFEGVTSH